MTDKISSPNVYLFAFQIHQDTKENNSLWHNCDNILAKFTDQNITPHLKFPPNSPYRVDLLPNVALKFNSNTNSLIEGIVQPIQIQDSYALFLNIGCPENEATKNRDVSFIEKFNPENVLLIDGDDYFVGQTLLVTGLLTDDTPRDDTTLKTLADNCRDALFHGNSSPIFYCSGKLFGSQIFEYDLINDIANYRHLLVWLFEDKQADKSFNACQQEILDLLFYRNKIIKSFQDSRKIYDELDSNYSIIEKNMELLQKQFSQGTVLTLPQLQEFQEQLKELLTKAVTYTSLLRKLEDYGNTIKINLYNYSNILQGIRVKLGNDKEELSILNHFSRKTAPYIRSQIAGDLGYFRHGTGLIEQAIASIRGIVEIEQARSELAEKNRGDRLESTIQAIGVGLAAGGIAASSGTDKLFETLQQNHVPAPLILWHPFVFSFVLSCAIALGSAAIVRCRTRPKN